MSQADNISQRNSPNHNDEHAEEFPNVHPVVGRSFTNSPSAADATVNSQALAPRSHNETGVSGGLDDPHTRVLIEKMLVALAQDGGEVNDRPASRFTFADYGLVFRRRWLPMLTMFLVTTALLSWRLKPSAPVYSATATMLLPSATSQLEDTNDPLKTGMSADAMGSNVATKIAMVTSPPRIREALEQLDPKIRERGWGSLKAESAPVVASAPISPDLIDITVTAADPDAAKALANQLIEEYAEYSQELVRGSFEKSLELLSGQKIQAEKLLLQAKRELQNYREQTGILSIDTRLTQADQAVAELQKEADEAQLEATAGAASQAVQADSTINSLRERSAAARSRYTAVLRDFLPNAPEARQARQELQEAQRLLSQRTSALQKRAQTRYQALRERLAEAQSAASALPSTEFKLSELDSKVKLLEVTYETLSDRYTAMSLARYNKVDSATTLTPAVGAVPVGRTWIHALVVAMLSGLVLACVVAALLEQLDNTVHSADQLEPLLRAPVLGTLPFLEGIGAHTLLSLAGNASPLALKEGAQGENKEMVSELPEKGALTSSNSKAASSMLLEACRIVRTNLMFAAVDAPLRSVLFTSADSGEGKSFSALNIATVMAYDGKKVILLDCDLRRPTQHRLSNLPLKPGFTNALMDPDILDEALQSTSVENLRIMTAGAIPPNPPELLGSLLSRNLIAELQERCDILVIDSPPVLNLTDAQVLSSIVDGVMLVVGASTTSMPHIHRAQTNIRNAGGRLLGSIYNKVRPRNDPYGYYGYYRYGAYKYYSYESRNDGATHAVSKS